MAMRRRAHVAPRASSRAWRHRGHSLLTSRCSRLQLARLVFDALSPRSIILLLRASSPYILTLPSPRIIPNASVPLVSCANLILRLLKCSCTNLVRIPLCPVSRVLSVGPLNVSHAFCLARPCLAGHVRPGPHRYCGGRLVPPRIFLSET